MSSYRSRTFLICFFAALFVSFNALAQKPAETDGSGVEALIRGIEKYHYQDAEKFASLFLDDGLLISSSGVAIKGAKNLQNIFTQRYASIHSGKIEISIEEVESTEGIAVVRGLITETVRPTKSAHPSHSEYYYSLLAKKVDGRWKTKWMMGVTKSRNGQ